MMPPLCFSPIDTRTDADNHVEIHVSCDAIFVSKVSKLREFQLQTKEDRLLDSASTILKSNPAASICVHYSLKWNYSAGVDQSFHRLQEFIKQMEALEGDHSILLVSGGGKKKKLDTIEVILRSINLHRHVCMFFCFGGH